MKVKCVSITITITILAMKVGEGLNVIKRYKICVKHPVVLYI